MAYQRPTVAERKLLQAEIASLTYRLKDAEGIGARARWACTQDVARHIQQIRNLENQIVTLMDFHAGRQRIAADKGEPNSNLALPAPVTEAEVKNPRLRWLRLKPLNPFKKS